MSLAFRNIKDAIRFQSKFVVLENGCWEWTAATFSKGYGQFTLGKFNHRAHRVSHWNYNGEFDTDLDVMHTCDFTGCVCPEHLVSGTNLQNRRDSVNKGRHNIGTRNGNSSLTEDKVILIRLMKEQGMSQAQIAIAFCVSPMTISRILRRERWTHV